MIRTEGPRSLYNGLVAGLQRQLCFASIRIGLYDNVKNFYTGGKDNPSVLIRILAGCTTGAMAVSFAQPTDVVKVRFQAQMNLNSVARRYSGTHAGLQTHLPERGFSGALERHAAQHHQKRTGQLHRAGDVRHDQGGHSEAQTHVRQSSVPLCVCVRRRLRHHGDRLPRGRGQDQVHELTAGPVQERHQLCLDDDDKRGANSVLQRICALISEAGVVEHRHVCFVRTNQESHDGHKKED
ncbi:unnamed protein product [Tetraodon nigroviridis]|uniref:(spotted green pufferfish) hypothetical protein n=1 Tax=Tetraodon nigroviridis TaxID=99883 RepID=Q4ST42_TETNG|nr:unnamed protein product [Tetraodon nigroviridis]